MADWLTCLAFTYRARVRYRAQKSFFIFAQIHGKFFTYSHLYAGNTMALLFFHENFLEKLKNLEIETSTISWVFIIGKLHDMVESFLFSKSFYGKIIVPSCSPHLRIKMWI